MSEQEQPFRGPTTPSTGATEEEEIQAARIANRFDIRRIIGGLFVLYGVIPTWQTEPHFGRVYAAYGGVFVVLSLLWGRLFDGFEPDRWDVLGALVCLGGGGAHRLRAAGPLRSRRVGRRTGPGR